MKYEHLWQRSVTIIIFVVVGLAITSCTTVKNKETIKSYTPSKAYLKPWNQGLKTIYIKGTISADYQNDNQSGGFKLMIDSYDSMALTLTGPLGIVVARLFSTSENFVFLNIFKNEVYTGVPNKENLSNALNIPLSFKELIQLLKCETPLPANNYVSLTGDDNLFKNNSHIDFSELVSIRQSDSLMMEYQRINKDGSGILSVNYESYYKFGGYKLARSIVMKFPSMNTKISIDIDEIKINEKFAKPFSFQIPDDANVIFIEH